MNVLRKIGDKLEDWEFRLVRSLHGRISRESFRGVRHWVFALTMPAFLAMCAGLLLMVLSTGNVMGRQVYVPNSVMGYIGGSLVLVGALIGLLCLKVGNTFDVVTAYYSDSEERR